jgi:hypothetical protein
MPCKNDNPLFVGIVRDRFGEFRRECFVKFKWYHPHVFCRTVVFHEFGVGYERLTVCTVCGAVYHEFPVGFDGESGCPRDGSVLLGYVNPLSIDKGKEIEIEVFKDSNGPYWMTTVDFEKLAPNLECDSSRIVKIILVNQKSGEKK